MGRTSVVALVMVVLGALSSVAQAGAKPVGPLVLARSAYRVEIAASPFQLTVRHRGQVVLRTTPGTIDFSGGSVTGVRSVDSSHGDLLLSLGTTVSDRTVIVKISPQSDRFQFSATLSGARPDQFAVHFDIAASGHWYGQGETAKGDQTPIGFQPWPLETDKPLDTSFGPAEYYMTDPFWFTSKGSGLQVRDNGVMVASMGNYQPGVFGLAVRESNQFDSTVFVEDTAREVYQDYVGIAGKPTKSDAPDYQYRSAVWNSWAQFYTGVTQQGFLGWAHGIHDAGIPAHTFSLDDGWLARYGDFEFNAKFPDPVKMAADIHGLGAKFGLWVTLWSNLDSKNYAMAASKGWLLKSKADLTKPCTVQWWDGTAGIIDLANPAANAWYVDQLHGLMSTYGVDGFKFDTRFFDEACQPYSPGLTMLDYQRLGATLADGFDLQGMGIRTHWTGSQQHGFVVREIDKGTSFDALGVAIRQLLALSTVGYPFVTSDMIGGSGGEPAPSKQVLVRWAQAAAATPLMYASTSPVGYGADTVKLYRDAVLLHGKLAPYILKQKDRALATGEPIMKPLFFNAPADRAAYTIGDEWLLGDSLLVAPVVSDATSRDVHLSPGAWYDVANHRVVHGDLRGYHADLSTLPLFVKLITSDTSTLITTLS